MVSSKGFSVARGFVEKAAGSEPRYTSSRASRFRTVEWCHSLPRAVRMLRAFSAAAIARTVTTPAARGPHTTGRTFAAKASADTRVAAA
jgi:hypothetical protein